MQTANRSMCVPSSTGPMFREDFCQSTRIFGQIFQWNGTILNERDWFSSTLHRHHYIKALLSNFSYSRLKSRLNRLYDRITVS